MALSSGVLANKVEPERENSTQPQVEANSSRATPIDHEHLSRYTLADRQLEAEILGLFCDQLSKSLGALKAARTPGEWKMAAHTLKGSARSVGAGRIADLALEAEQAADTRVSAEEEARLLAELGDASAEVQSYIAQYTDAAN